MSSATDTVNTSDVKPLINDFDVETQEAVSPTPGGPPTMIMPVAHGRPALFRVKCGYCRDIFLFHRRTCIAKCPHCRRTSPVGDYAKQRATLYGVLGVVLLLAGVGVTVGTYEIAKNSGGIYVVWIGAFVSGILFLIRSCYYGAMTVSSIEEEPLAIGRKQLP